MFEPTYSLAFFLENLQYTYLQRALFATMFSSIACGIIGVLLVLKGLSFLGDGIAHSAFAGGALAILLGLNPFFSILGFGVASAFLVGYINEKKATFKEDAPVGIMFAFTMALAILFVGLMDRYSVNIPSLLFGSALTIPESTFIYLIVFTIIIITLFFLFKKELFLISFDEDFAKVTGIPVRFLNYLFLFMIAGIITASIQAIGVLLVVAMIIIPAVAAYQFSYNFNRMLILAGIFGGLSAFIGIALAFMYDIPTGATIVLTATAIFLIAFIISPKRRAHQFTMQRDQTEHQKECQYCRVSGDTSECPFCKDEDHEECKDQNHKKTTHHHDLHESHTHEYDCDDIF